MTDAATVTSPSDSSTASLQPTSISDKLIHAVKTSDTVLLSTLLSTPVQNESLSTAPTHTLANTSDSDGNSLLHWAAWLKNHQTIHILIQKHADVNAKNKRGESVLEWAIRGGDLTTFQYLLQAHADVNTRNTAQASLMHIAAEEGNSDILSCLHILNPQLIDSEDQRGKTPFHCACHRGQVESIKWLLLHEVDIFKCDHENGSALHYLAISGLIGEAQNLLKKGIAVYMHQKAFKEKLTPLELAERYQHEDMVFLLQKHTRRNPQCTSKLIKAFTASSHTTTTSSLKDKEKSAKMTKRPWISIPQIYYITAITLTLIHFYFIVHPALYPIWGLESGSPARSNPFQTSSHHMDINADLDLPVVATKQQESSSTPTQQGEIPLKTLYEMDVRENGDPNSAGYFSLSFLLITLYTTAFLAIFCMFTFQFLSPGYLLPKQSLSKQDLLALCKDVITGQPVCAACRVKKTVRSKHCNQCGICVLRLDHHCPWVNNCVGASNHRPFFIVIISQLISAFLHWYLSGAYILDIETGDFQSKILAGIFNLHSLFVFIGCLALFVGQSHTISQGLTTNEAINKHRYAYLSSFGGSSPWSQGIFKNCLSFWGLDKHALAFHDNPPDYQEMLLQKKQDGREMNDLIEEGFAMTSPKAATTHKQCCDGKHHNHSHSQSTKKQGFKALPFSARIQNGSLSSSASTNSQLRSDDSVIPDSFAYQSSKKNKKASLSSSTTASSVKSSSVSSLSHIPLDTSAEVDPDCAYLPTLTSGSAMSSRVHDPYSPNNSSASFTAASPASLNMDVDTSKTKDS